MSERYVTLSTFKYGLDGRRDALSNVPGTLAELINAHINAGGEIEQRQSFVKSANTFPSLTFGLQDTDVGLMTFGSDDPPIANLPAGVTYQKLAHPTGWTSIGGGPLPVAVIMTRVDFSCNYLGKAFVIASFSDGKRFCYYDGNLVLPTRNGLVLSEPGLLAETPAYLAIDLAAQFNAITGWSATANFAIIGGVVVAYPGAVIVTSPPSVHFTPAPSVSSAAGQLSATLVDQNYPGVAQQAAMVVFTLNAGTNGTVTITAPATKAGTGTVQLTGGAITFDTSLAQTAADITDTINLLSGSTGYTALRTGAVITVFAPITFGNFTSNLTIVTTGDITTIPGGGSTTQFKVLLTNNGLSPNGGNLIVAAVSNEPLVVSGTVFAGFKGAAGAVTFSWVEVNADGTPVTPGFESGIQLSSSSAPSVAFSALVTPGTQTVSNAKIGHFVCTGSDAGSGATSKVFFTVTLSLFKLNS